jgi:hypothetical protein
VEGILEGLVVHLPLPAVRLREVTSVTVAMTERGPGRPGAGSARTALRLDLGDGTSVALQDGPDPLPKIPGKEALQVLPLTGVSGVEPILRRGLA